jgi:hypothetical protein
MGPARNRAHPAQVDPAAEVVPRGLGEHRVHHRGEISGSTGTVKDGTQRVEAEHAGSIRCEIHFMITIALRCVVLAIAVCGVLATLAGRQTGDANAEPQLARELTYRVFGSDGTWQWTPVVDNRPGPIVQSEKQVLFGLWQRVRGDAYVRVSIHVVDSFEDAEQWLAVHAKGAKDWTIKRYPAGDGAWRAEHRAGEITLSSRRRLHVITVSSKDAGLVERCTRQIILYLDSR